MSNEFLNFSEISQQVKFEQLLNWLNISFTRNSKELKGEGFIINIEKNVYINPKNKEEKGSIINFLSTPLVPKPQLGNALHYQAGVIFNPQSSPLR